MFKITLNLYGETFDFSANEIEGGRFLAATKNYNKPDFDAERLNEEAFYARQSVPSRDQRDFLEKISQPR